MSIDPLMSYYADLSNVRADTEKLMPKYISKPMCWVLDKVRKHVALKCKDTFI